MANAEFDPGQSSLNHAGGFEVGSYRSEKKNKEPEQSLTPIQKRLAALERRLPDALKRTTAAVAILAVVAVGSTVGLGGAKLHRRAEQVRQLYTVGVAADGGYTISEELTERSYAAANVITSAMSTYGLDKAGTEVAQAQTALNEFEAQKAELDRGKGSMHAMYQANVALGAAIDQLYAKMQENAPNPMQMGAVQGQYGNFNSAGTILANLSYNDEVTRYHKETSGIPAAMLEGWFRIQEVERFA